MPSHYRLRRLTLLLFLLAGCARGPQATTGDAAANAKPFSGQSLNVFNWSDYIDKDLIPLFEERTGAKVQYDNYSTDSELETKMLAGGGGYDVIFPSDRGMAPLVHKKALLELDKSKLPHLKLLDPKFLGPRYDPGNRFSVPYFWGTLAVGIRDDHVSGPVKGFEPLFDPRFKGRIVMYDDAETVVAAALLHLGLPMNSTEDADLAKVKALLLSQKPLVQAWTQDAYKEKLQKDEAWVALGWNGDILQARKEEPKIRAVVPESGTMLWVDSMAIPKDAKNIPLAHEFINFMLDPDIAARNAEFVQYATPNLEARKKIKRELLDDPSIYPPRQLLDRCQWLQDRGPAIAKIEQLWKEVRR